VDRLIDRKGPPVGAEAELAGLVEACEAVRISAARKAYSLNAIYARHHERRRSVRFTTRFAMAAGVLLAAGAATAAAFGVRFRSEPAPPATLALAPAPIPHHLARAPRPAAPIAAPAPPVEAAPPAVEPSPSARFHHAQLHAHLVKSEDPSLVVSAIQALRQDHDPDRAARLLAGYLRTYPRGALAEEAVALSIEAADARRSPAATAFAERYLREYPNGRFRQTAARVLARPTL
jgi:hypothetical protein